MGEVQTIALRRWLGNLEERRSGQKTLSFLTYLLTFTCYGQRLHGDERGSVDRRQNTCGSRPHAPNNWWESAERAAMKFGPFELAAPHRRIALDAIREAVPIRKWQLHAVHIRSTHVHVVVSGDEKPEEIMRTLKASVSRRLREDDGENRRRWARFGSTVYLWTEKAVNAACRYVLECQGEPMVRWPDGSD